MTDIVERDLQAAIQAWDQAAWSLAALALAARDDDPPELTAAAREVLAATGLTSAPGKPLTGLDAAARGQVASQAAAGLHQASALVSGRSYHWGAQRDEARLAQGNMSAQAGVSMARFLLPMMDDLAGRLAAPGARMLDVGTGVGAAAIAFAQAFPQLQVLGIDILDRSLDLAREAVAAAGGVADRVAVRKQDVAEFADDDAATGFDVAWLPAPFIPPAAIDSGLPRITAALRPGGWLILGHGKLGGTPVEVAVTRLKTIAYGGTALDEAAACHLLRSAGLTSVRPVPTQAWAPAITIGQKQP